MSSGPKAVGRVICSGAGHPLPLGFGPCRAFRSRACWLKSGRIMGGFGFTYKYSFFWLVGDVLGGEVIRFFKIGVGSLLGFRTVSPYHKQ